MSRPTNPLRAALAAGDGKTVVEHLPLPWPDHVQGAAFHPNLPRDIERRLINDRLTPAALGGLLDKPRFLARLLNVRPFLANVIAHHAALPASVVREVWDRAAESANKRRVIAATPAMVAVCPEVTRAMLTSAHTCEVACQSLQQLAEKPAWLPDVAQRCFAEAASTADALRIAQFCPDDVFVRTVVRNLEAS